MSTESITLDQADAEFCGDVLVAAFDAQYGGANYWLREEGWALITLTKSMDGDSEADDTWLSIEFTDPHGKTHLVDHDGIRAAMHRIVTESLVNDTLTGYVLCALGPNGDAGDIDADAADVIVQLAVFGEVLFG